MSESEALTIEGRKDAEGNVKFYLAGQNADKYELVTQDRGQFVKFGIICKGQDNIDVQ